MPGFSFRSQKEPSPEEPNTPESEATRERAARLRDLDEEIRHRRGELRASKEAEHAGPAPRASGERGVRTSPAEPEEEALADPIAATIEDALKDLLKLAGRVEALESSVREAQQRNWEALQTHEKTVNERIEELERRADDAAAEVAKGPTEAGERLEQRFAELEKRVSKASKARTRSGERIEKLEGRLDEIGRTQPSLEKRLAGLERALDGAVEQRLAGLEKLADEAAAGAIERRGPGWRPDRASLRTGSRPSRNCPSGFRRSASRSSRFGSSRTTCAPCASRSRCAGPSSRLSNGTPQTEAESSSSA